MKKFKIKISGYIYIEAETIKDAVNKIDCREVNLNDVIMVLNVLDTKEIE
jgi:hypothetical protein